MKPFLTYVICSVSVLLLKPTAAYPRSGLELGGSRARRHTTCREDQYQHGGLCCLKCEAGKYVKSPCTKPETKGQCEECDYNTYIEHENNLNRCFTCKQCRSDQEIVRPCTHTQDTTCQCKSGRFCHIDQACEVCKKCSRCAEDEVIVRNCTSTTNTECKKIQNKSDSAPVIAVVVVSFIVLLAGIIVVFVCKKKLPTDCLRNRPDRIKVEEDIQTAEDEETQRSITTNLILPQHLVRAKSSSVAEDKRKILSESLSSSASNSQHSLTGLLTPASQASPVVPDQHHRREDEPLAKLVPVNDDESLKRCFDLFEELDVDYHKRFFRQLEISDNIIKSKESLPYEDRIHELLNFWVEKEGKGASLNALLQALIVLNQRRTAEIIHQKALDSGHYHLPM
ncbi:tumor necrosis factor receptor superfamily member 10B-like isoform X1 [Archocentrus centrarchus]|uniref:tumor necrosis factor receptor superfamily member 10B-like isoform X1 n=1 Tax=Archocentrus centrarchus TaxID=63155 RepID=UPI0011E9E469|nr:tumor necrosis factor receptor superfamily member 10B-like isoform X1 [Archocentrus centrarchus]